MIRAAIVVTLLVLGTAAAAQALCAGDLDGDCEVRVDEVVTCVGSALEADALISLACDLDHDGSVSIAEMISGVRNALFGCAEKTSGPPPGAQVLFRLAEGSSVTLPDGSEVAIDGSFLVSRCFSPNTFFAGRIETLRFIGHSVVVQGGCSAIGEIVASTLYGGDTPTSFSSQVLVNDESSVLSGQGPYGSFTRLDLTLTAGEYSFRVIAEPDEYRNTEAGEPLCYDWGFV